MSKPSGHSDTEIREQIEDELRQMFMEVGVKLTEIGWEVAEENILDTATKIQALIEEQTRLARIEGELSYAEELLSYDSVLNDKYLMKQIMDRVDWCRKELAQLSNTKEDK